MHFPRIVLLVSAIVVAIALCGTSPAAAQADRAGRPAHCHPVPADTATTAPFCGSLVAGRWVALAPPRNASALARKGLNESAVVDATLLSLDTFARAAVGNWSRALLAVDCREDHHRYSLFRTCTDCVHAYRVWACRSLFLECAANATVSDPKSTVPGAFRPLRSDAPDAFRGLGMQYLAKGKPPLDDLAGDINPRLLASTNPEHLGMRTLPSPPVKLDRGLAERAAAVLARAELADTVPEYPSRPPCLSTCNRVVQACPSSLMFACPRDHDEVWTAVIGDGEDTAAAAALSVVFPDYQSNCED
ncbi:hypothetical protein H9P43_000764 [Blastocladiella emersonii ATCC 22665]|nr:hypothetical protein H9P43_000764 [Blastocladiella emersonii ATCC 22665]